MIRLSDLIGDGSSVTADRLAYELAADAQAARRLAHEMSERPVLDERPFEELLPGLSRVPDPAPQLREGIGVRSYNTLMRAQIDSWPRLAAVAPRDLRRIPNFGAKSFVEVLEVVFRAWGEAKLSGQDALSGNGAAQAAPADSGPVEFVTKPAFGSDEIRDDLQAILRSLWRDTGATTLGEALDGWQQSDPPEETAQARRRLLAVDLETLLGIETTPEEAWCKVLTVPESWSSILRERILTSGKKSTLEKLGQELGVTRERVRQIEGVVRRTLRERLDDESGMVLRHLAARLARRLGAVIDEAAANQLVEEAVSASSVEPVEDRSLREELLRTLCGPYTSVGGLLWSPEGRTLLAAAERELARIGPGGVVEGEVLSRLLAGLNAQPEHDDAIQGHLGLRRVGAKFVLWKGSLSDKAAGCLEATGEPMSLLELHEAFGFDCNPRSLSNQIQNDPRLMRRGKERYGLRAWGGEEYSGILDEIEQAIERAGGSVDLEALVSEFVAEFGVAAHSVRSYAADRRFVRTGSGRLELRTDEHPEVACRGRPIEAARGAFLLGGIWHVRFEVDSDALRGSGRAIGSSIARSAGLEPDLTLGFDYDGGNVTFSWSGKQPAIGSIRGIVVLHSCVEGDLVFVPLDGAEPRPTRAVRAAERNREVGPRRLAVEMGLDPNDVGETDPLVIAVALGLAVGADWHDVADRLRERGETLLASYLPAEWR